MERPHQSSHKGTDQLDGAVGKDHDDISVGNTGIVQVIGDNVGRFVDLAVRKCPSRRP